MSYDFHFSCVITAGAVKKLLEPKRRWWRFWRLMLLAALPAVACASGHAPPPAAQPPVCTDAGVMGVATKGAGLPGMADTLRRYGVGGATPVPVVPDVFPELNNREQVRAALIRYYPQALKDQGIGGEVRVAALIGPDGRVSQTWIRSTSGIPELDQAAANVVRVMVFTPAVYRGCRIPMWAPVPVIFRTTG